MWYFVTPGNTFIRLKTKYLQLSFHFPHINKSNSILLLDPLAAFYY